jgi:16S rRNA (guanine966-N2)-methyltransferase
LKKFGDSIMRVISGVCKGRPLKAVQGMTTRPTTDKVKESLFNIIGPFFDGGNVLDLFSGSGSLGLEALSRGMEKGVFVEKDPKALQVIKGNIQACRMEEESEVLRSDALRSIKMLGGRGVRFDLIMMDPPYKIANSIPSILSEIEENQLLAEDGLIICEHGKELELPEQIGSFVKYRHEKYGITAISFFRSQDDA